MSVQTAIMKDLNMNVHVCNVFPTEPIAQDYRTVVCPFIDVIDYENFAYRAQDEGARGAFDWEFFYKRLPLLPENLKRPAEPFKLVPLKAYTRTILYHALWSVVWCPQIKYLCIQMSALKCAMCSHS